jgi:hypothetical protein
MSRSIRGFVASLFVLAAAVPVVLAATITPASADATILVSVFASDGAPGSLRAAFAAADSNGVDTTIVLVDDGATYSLTDCSGNGGALDHTASTALTIDGRGSTIEQTCPGERVISNVGSAGHLTLADVTITGGNVGDLTAGGGVGATTAGLTITGSTITGNTAGSGGAVFVTGGGSVTVVNSTIAGNTATSDTGGGGIEAQGDATLVYSTITGNTAGGSDEPANIRTGGDLISFGSVLAEPLGTNALNCIVTGTTTSQGDNFSDDNSCDFNATGDRQDAGDPGLGALAYENNVPTGSLCIDFCSAWPVRIPQTGSPLVDAIPTAACQTGAAAGVTNDELQQPRPSPAGGACDIGAVEVQAVAPDVPPQPPVGPPVVVPPRFTG